MRFVSGSDSFQAGYTFIEILISTAILSIAFYFLASSLNNVNIAVQRNDYNAAINGLKSNFSNMILDREAWNQTLAKNTSLACWNSASGCATAGAKDFTPYGSNGALYQGYNSLVASNGFSLGGEFCNSFSLTVPSAACPIHINFVWTPVCSSTGPCFKPESNVAINFVFSFPTGKTPSNINMNGFNKNIRIYGQSMPIRMTGTGARKCASGKLVVGFDPATGELDCQTGTTRIY